jgi:hypothetical protein
MCSGHTCQRLFILFRPEKDVICHPFVGIFGLGAVLPASWREGLAAGKVVAQ